MILHPTLRAHKAKAHYQDKMDEIRESREVDAAYERLRASWDFLDKERARARRQEANAKWRMVRRIKRRIKQVSIRISRGFRFACRCESWSK